MKKILLIIALTFIIFQMVVLAADIDIGSAAIDRAYANSIADTWIVKENPANANGTITSIEIYCNQALQNCEVATFYSTGIDEFSTRDTHFIGTVTAGSKQTFSGLDIDVETGDYLGYYASGGKDENDNSGTGVWFKYDTDAIPCTETGFTFIDDATISFYGTGTTEEEEEDNVIFFGMNF